MSVEIPVTASSDPANGAVNISADGSSFYQNYLTGTISIPPDAINPRIAATKATVWYSTLNVSPALANNTFTWTDDLLDPTKYSVTLEPGLYGIPDLNAALDILVQQLGQPAGLFVISGIASTQQATLTITQAGYQVNATVVTSFLRETGNGLLGFDSQLMPPASLTVARYTKISENVANLGRLSSYQIRSGKFGGGMVFGGKFSNIITTVPIGNTPVRQLISLEFKTLVWCPCPKARGDIADADWTLTDQNGVPVNTNSEVWSAEFILKYDKPADKTATQFLANLALATNRR